MDHEQNLEARETTVYQSSEPEAPADQCSSPVPVTTTLMTNGLSAPSTSDVELPAVSRSPTSLPMPEQLSYSPISSPSTSSSIVSPSKDDCIKCSEKNGEEVVGCDKCDRWTHLSCADLTKEYVDIITNYYCEDCEDNDHLTSWRKVRGTVAQRIRKDREYYEVNKIIGHRPSATRPNRDFLIEWKEVVRRTGRHAQSWEPEEHLDGSIDLLQKYCRQKKIPLSNIIGLAGANTESNNLERGNWATMDTILSKFDAIRSWAGYSKDILAKEWTKPEGKDALYFLNYNFHCYVLLYVHKLQAAYIADGGNLFRTEQTVADRVRKIVKIRLISLTYDQQLKVDHCASSAILIGLELLRMHSTGQRIFKLVTTKAYRDKVTRSLHQLPSQPLELPPLRQRRSQLVCPHCAKTYKSTQRKSLNSHIIRQHRTKE